MPLGRSHTRAIPGYAESYAPTSVTGAGKSVRSVARSVAESSFVGTDDSDELGRSVGCLDCDWVETLRKTGKRNRGPLVLPPELLPQVYWSDCPKLGKKFGQLLTNTMVL